MTGTLKVCRQTCGPVVDAGVARGRHGGVAHTGKTEEDIGCQPASGFVEEAGRSGFIRQAKGALRR